MLRAMTVAALVLGAGRGERFVASGGMDALPKALVPVLGKSSLARSLGALAACPHVARVQPVLAAEWLGDPDLVRQALGGCEGVAAPVAGGRERQDSVAAGLAALPEACTHVAVHDAARPLVTPAAVSRVVEAALETGAALLATPVRDTLHRAVDSRVVETPGRTGLVAAQTPQVFRRDWLEAALDAARRDGVVGTDDAGLVARLGHPVAIVEGDPDNVKITTEADRRLVEAVLRARGEGA